MCQISRFPTPPLIIQLVALLGASIEWSPNQLPVDEIPSIDQSTFLKLRRRDHCPWTKVRGRSIPAPTRSWRDRRPVRAPIIENLQASDVHIGFVNVDPVVGGRRTASHAAHKQAGRDETSVWKIGGNLRDISAVNKKARARIAIFDRVPVLGCIAPGLV
jgi:hypothetical protein